MKPFDLEKALAGAPLILRNGNIVDEFFYSKTCLYEQPIVSVSYGYMKYHSKDGRYFVDGTESAYDLFMAPSKREGWLVKHKDNSQFLVSVCIFSTEEVARESVEGDQYEYIKVEWEE